MVKYRCAACGSPKVMVDVEADGISYDYKKGFVGTVVFGTGGAVAGIESNRHQVYKCPECGVSLSYPMQEPYKSVIDIGVDNLGARDSLQIYGLRVRWERLKQQYPNIEDGYAEKEIAWRAANEKATLEALADAWNDDVIHAKMSVSELEIEESIWMQKNAKVKTWRDEAITTALEAKNKECEREIVKRKQEHESEIDNLNRKSKQLHRKIEELTGKIQTLNVFQFSTKKKLNEEIENIRVEIQSIHESIRKKVEQRDTCDAAIRKEYEKIKKQKVADVTRKYSISESPKTRVARISEYMEKYVSDYWDNAFSLNQRKAILREYLPVLLKNYGQATLKEMAPIMEKFFTKVIGDYPSATMSGSSLIYKIEQTINDHYSGIIVPIGTAEDWANGRLRYEYQG